MKGFGLAPRAVGPIPGASSAHSLPLADFSCSLTPSPTAPIAREAGDGAPNAEGGSSWEMISAQMASHKMAIGVGSHVAIGFAMGLWRRSTRKKEKAVALAAANERRKVDAGVDARLIKLERNQLEKYQCGSNQLERAQGAKEQGEKRELDREPVRERTRVKGARRS